MNFRRRRPDTIGAGAEDCTKPSKGTASGMFDFSIFAGDKCWVAGVELATASEPPARKPRIWGRRRSGVDPSQPLRCNLLLNLAPPRQQSSLGKEKRPALPSVLLVGRTETTGRLLR